MTPISCVGHVLFIFFGVDLFALGSKRKPNSQWNIGGVGCLALGLCVGHVHFMCQVTQTLPNAIPLFGGIWALMVTRNILKVIKNIIANMFNQINEHFTNTSTDGEGGQNYYHLSSKMREALYVTPYSLGSYSISVADFPTFRNDPCSQLVILMSYLCLVPPDVDL